MSKGLSLLGVGHSGLYQLAAIIPAFNVYVNIPMPMPCIAFGVVSMDTGLLTDADSAPVKWSPGFLQQGRKDYYGDSQVHHGSVKGWALPTEVETTLAAALHPNPDYSVAYEVYNYTSTAFTKLFGFGMATGSLIFGKSRVFGDPGICHSYRIATPSYVMDYSLYVKGGYWYFDCITDSLAWSIKHHIQFSGNPLQCDSSKESYFLYGSYSADYTYKPSSTQYHVGSDTSTGLVYMGFCPPTSLDNIPKEVILTGIEQGPLAKINSRLLSLDTAAASNGPFEACVNAVSGVELLDFQWLEFFRDSYNWRELVGPIRRYREIAINWKHPRTWAELYLWVHYGIMPTLRDLKALIVALNTLLRCDVARLLKQYSSDQIVYGTNWSDLEIFDMSWTVRCNARVRFVPSLQPRDTIEALFQFFKFLDIGIDFTNLWELVPYSFVVDWFVNTGKAVEWLDLSFNAKQYDVKQCVLSSKFETQMYLDKDYVGMAGSVKLTSYSRDINVGFPEVPFDFKLANPSGHWLEGLALIVART